MQTYINNIEIAFLSFPFILFFTFLPVMLYQYKKVGYSNGKRTLVVYLAIFYGIVAYFMVILPLPKITPDFCDLRATNSVANFEFFRFIKEMIAENGGNMGLISLLKTKTFIVTVFNLLLLLPLGFFLRYLYKLK
jgi:glycopeptide antibiotics resistance protein